jgi:hypothetical protein
LKQYRTSLWRLSLILLILVGMWQGAAWHARRAASAGASFLAGGAAARGITLTVSPASIPPGVTSQLTVSAKDSSGRPIVGAVISLSGARVVAGALRTGSQPLLVRVTPDGTRPVLVAVRHAGYLTISGRVMVASPPAPALVSALRPSLQVIARGVTLSQPASLHEALQFQWRAMAGPADRGSLTFADGSVMDLNHNTTVLIKGASRTFLQTGQVFLQVVSGGQSHDIETGSAIAASLGTRYVVSNLLGNTTVTVLAGRVAVVNAGKAVSIGANQQSSVRGHTAPSAPSRVNGAALVAWAANLPVVPDATLVHIAYLLLDQGNTLATFSLDSQKVIRTDHLPIPGVHMVVGQENDTLSIATRLGIVVVPLHGGKIRILAAGVNAVDLAALPHHRLAVADVDKNRVVVVNTTSGAILGFEPLGYQPSGVAAATDGRTAIVVGTGEISLVDLAQGSVLTTRDVSGRVGRPAIAPDGSLAYALLPQTGQLAVLSLAARGVIATVNLKVRGAVAAALTAAANASAVVGADSRVYVLDPFTRAIDVLDPVTNAMMAQYRLPAQPLSIALTQDGKLMIVTAQPSGTLIIDPLDGTILSQAGVAGASGPQAFPPPIRVSRTGGSGAGMPAPAANSLVVSSVPAAETVQTQPHQFQATETPLPAMTFTPTTTPSPLPSGTGTPVATDTSTSTPAATLTPTVAITATATATSTATTTPAGATCLSWNVSGTWVFTASPTSQLGSGTGRATFTQYAGSAGSASTISGTMLLNNLTYSVTGSLSGSSLTLTYSAPGQVSTTDQGSIGADGKTISGNQGKYQGAAACTSRG